jgi:hypothetical protein
MKRSVLLSLAVPGAKLLFWARWMSELAEAPWVETPVGETAWASREGEI